MPIRLPKIFLDSGDPEETKKAKGLLGHLEGQTTNPTLVGKNPAVQQLISKGKRLTESDLLKAYKEIVQEIEKEIAGAISVEVNANWETTAQQMLKQADEMYTWGRNIHIKFPTIPEGVKAAHEFSNKGGRVNMTLVFTQVQAAAVYVTTLGTKQTHFVSPFMGRWDDRGYNGSDLIRNILHMYKEFDKQMNRKHSVELLAASIRTLDHLYASIYLGADIITMSYKLIQEWVAQEIWVPSTNYRIESSGLKSLKYERIPLRKNYEEYMIEKTDGDLLDEGLRKFANDWRKILDPGSKI